MVAHQHIHRGGILVRHRCGSRDRQGPGLCRGAGGAHGLLRTGDGAATLGNKRCWHFYALGGGRMAIRGDRKSVVKGTSVPVLVDLGVRRIIKKKKKSHRENMCKTQTSSSSNIQ